MTHPGDMLTETASVVGGTDSTLAQGSGWKVPSTPLGIKTLVSVSSLMEFETLTEVGQPLFRCTGVGENNRSRLV